MAKSLEDLNTPKKKIKSSNVSSSKTNLDNDGGKQTEKWFTEEPAIAGHVFVREVKKRQAFDKNRYKKVSYHISHETIEKLSLQPCTEQKAVTALIEFAIEELERQNKMLVIDLGN